MKICWKTLFAVFLLIFFSADLLSAENVRIVEQRALKAYQSGNYADAYKDYQSLLTGREAHYSNVTSWLSTAIQCLSRLNRQNESDAFLEKVIEVQANNWRVFQGAANLYARTLPHYGYLIAGEFKRGQHRGGGRQVSSFQRDRVRSLQLIRAGEAYVLKSGNEHDIAGYYATWTTLIKNHQYGDRYWRLQVLTDISKLPDYEEQSYGGGDSRGIPVDAEGNPVYFHVPEDFNSAENDGERWRWTQEQSVKYVTSRREEVDRTFAGYMRQHFGVRSIGRQFAGGLKRNDGSVKDESGTYALHTLSDAETLVKLTTGVKRITLPDEFNFIRIYQKYAEREDGKYYTSIHVEALAEIYEDRRQYSRAAEMWKLMLGKYNQSARIQKRLDQIVGAWGKFEPQPGQVAGKNTEVQYRFRNGKNLKLEAFPIDIEKLTGDIKEYLEANPKQVEHRKVSIDQIGYRLVVEGESHYLGESVKSWQMDLEPLRDHFDRRIVIDTGLKKAGAYLLKAEIAGGNTSNIIVWIDNTVIVRKKLDSQFLYFVADAQTGKAVPKIEVNFFGYETKRVENLSSVQRMLGRHYNVITTSFSRKTDSAGQIILSDKEQSSGYQWLLTARGSDRVAYLGFSGIWYSRHYDEEYNQTKVFSITDRPVYRPDQTVKYKLWVRQAKYDQADTSAFAGRNFTVEIRKPRGEKILTETKVADSYGGISGELSLKKDADLGVYSIRLLSYGSHSGGTFRVEEYKKPEFEVTVEAPSEPLMLGEEITAKIQAKYYFGAPVTKATVKYKVLRKVHSASWYPPGIWDWLYGAGYWWFGVDYDWYPRFREWCVKSPIPFWWQRPSAPPELISENEVEIGSDGTVPVVIDTLAAKELHGDEDHSYEITAEVVDESRRTIVGQGKVLVARKPFKVYTWLDKGYYRTGDTVKASFSASTLDRKPVQGKGQVDLLRISYRNGDPIEKKVQSWNLNTDSEGKSSLQITARSAGQYRLSYRVRSSKGQQIEGGYIFTVRGRSFKSDSYRFNEIELIPENREYKAGDTLNLAVNANNPNATILLFIRPSNGIYLSPQVLKLEGKSSVVPVKITMKDMPNFFIEALTVHNGKVHTAVKEIVVPPVKRILNIEVTPSKESYKPGEKASLKVRVTDIKDQPYQGSLVLTVYDKALEYISGGSNVPEIKEFFWKWRRRHNPDTLHSLQRLFRNLIKKGASSLSPIGFFGETVADDVSGMKGNNVRMKKERGMVSKSMGFSASAISGGIEGREEMMDQVAAPAMEMEAKTDKDMVADAEGGSSSTKQPVVRKSFADSVLWKEALSVNAEGEAEIEFTMPENLSTWKMKAWAVGHGTRVGEGEASAVTTKNLLLRQQAPRFFVEKDEVVLSANIHNYLDTEKKAEVKLELEGDNLKLLEEASKTVSIPAGGEVRVDWRVQAVKEGEALIRMFALTDEESDAMEQKFPVHVHGMLKTESYSGALRPEDSISSFMINIPRERRAEQSRIEVRYSPTLAGAMVDALPYLVSYPYGCTEQTLNRFLPTVFTQKIIQRLGVDLREVQEKLTNLNAQEIGDSRKRAEGWKRYQNINPVFDYEEVQKMVRTGLTRLQNMQLTDGGWGWFSGYGEHSYPHTTAYVVHGLQVAKANDAAVDQNMLQRGIHWLQNYQAGELQKLKNAPSETKPWKTYAEDLDAFVFMVLGDAGSVSEEMGDLLFRDKTKLAVYGKSMLALAFHAQKQSARVSELRKNIEQYLVQDDENQTAYLNLGNGSYWWYWYGSEYEAHAYYLKLLAAVDPKSQVASRMVKYLLNNRKHATYWKSTRDTAVVLEAFADYLKGSAEMMPDTEVEVYLDGKLQKKVHITRSNLFDFDGTVLLEGAEIESGKHKVEFRKKGGPLYYNAYVTNFTLEDYIKRAGLEVKVNRKFYKLNKVDKTVDVSGMRGQALKQKVEKYEREELPNLSELKSGDLVEIELEIDSKNDYEYLIFEDMKAAGFEAVDLRSGYTGNDLGAYVEYRDNRAVFFVRRLARGKHSVSYRLRAEIPGKFSALPARASAMYAPELRGNSDEMKIIIED